MKILLKNARIISPQDNLDINGDMLIDSGKIAKIGKGLKGEADKELDCTGKIIAPGLIDMHAHLREPGREDKETIKTGLMAAAKGGFTTVCVMPNTEPPCDSQSQVKFIIGKAGDAKLGQVLPIGTITKKRAGQEISEMNELREAGCPAVSDDGSSVLDSGLMRTAMEYAAMLDLLVISHCEDPELAGKGVMHEGYFSTVLGLAPIPSKSESIIVERDIQLAELAGARLHIAHVSAAESVDIIRKAKKRGVKVTAEVTPHHLTLKDEDLKGYDTNMKVNPPLRGERDIKALKQGLKDGTIDVIATDHAPHLESEKETEFDYAPFGMIGLETALPLAREALIDGGILDWPELIDSLSGKPAKILGRGGGNIKEGVQADIIVIDPDETWVYEKTGIISKSQNSPFIGRELKGKVTEVISRGRLLVERGELVV